MFRLFLLIFVITCRWNDLAPTFSLRNFIFRTLMTSIWSFICKFSCASALVMDRFWNYHFCRCSQYWRPSPASVVFQAVFLIPLLPSSFHCIRRLTPTSLATWAWVKPASSIPTAWMRTSVLTMMLFGNVVFSNKSRSVLDVLYKCTYFMYTKIKSKHDLVLKFSY